MSTSPSNPRTRRHAAVVARPSSTDVAKLAGVSQSTVSRVYASAKGVSDASRERVRAAAETLGYEPTALPGILQSGASGLIAVFVSTVKTPAVAALIDCLARNLIRRQSLMLLIPQDPEGRDTSAGQRALLYQPDGMVFIGLPPSRTTKSTAARSGRPVAIVPIGATKRVDGERRDDLCVRVVSHLTSGQGGTRTVR